ncbi:MULTISPECIES: PaaI family thioesterase [Vibrio]|uniref:Acyl-coenzyme A thioesterase THEM4 n=1 Tax=Vibrio bivalvicida TaxID=1276888 RepID=A0A177XXH4_9VIBR|nr:MULTISPECIES: PaaI family thioesterase [Vibrio]KLN63792.1 thioesterase [Vibrio sp. VPAP30]OAJ93281.1 thioesterase [Vibrio bivalvicida]
MTHSIAIQDQIPNNHCYGCGAENEHGLQIKSYWQSDSEASCEFVPHKHHCAGPTHFLNGGIISTIIDCHCVCMAIAKGYQLSGQEVGKGEPVWFATGSLNISFLKPVAMDSTVTLKAKVVEAFEKKIVLECELHSQDSVCCRAEVIAVKVPNEWFSG